MKEIFLHKEDIPKNCFECKFTDENSDFPNIWCVCTDELINDGETDITEVRHPTCPLYPKE